jgi:transposase
MPTPESQLQSLLEAVEQLLQAQTALKNDNRVLRDQLKAAEEALNQAKQERSSHHNLSTPTPSIPALTAEELDALVEEIDSCIALLKP